MERDRVRNNGTLPVGVAGPSTGLRLRARLAAYDSEFRRWAPCGIDRDTKYPAPGL